jgi:cell division protein FtsZ
MNEVIPIDRDKKSSCPIKVMGVGSGGTNAVNNMYKKGIKGAEFVICSTDTYALDYSPVSNKILFGANLKLGLSAGCNPNVGRQAAESSIDEIRKVFENTEMVIIVARLGGETGTGAVPVIAKEAKGMGILTVAIIILPFIDEGEEPYQRAIKGLINLMEHVDSLLIIRNEKLFEIYPDLSIFEAFPKADDVIATTVKSIVEIITYRGYLNVDYSDLKMAMQNTNMALMGYGAAKGENRGLKAVEQALKSPFMNDIRISDAKNILINISCGKRNPLKTFELHDMMQYISKEAGGVANIKRGAILNELLDAEDSDAEIAVTIIATGFSMEVAYPDVYEAIKEYKES